MISILGEPSPFITIQTSGDFYQSTVGQRQDVICTLSVPPDVNPDDIELGWLINEDDIITDDSRVTIITSSNNSSNSSSNFSTSIIRVIRFDPLYEDDEGNYSCYSIINKTEISTFIYLRTRGT